MKIDNPSRVRNSLRIIGFGRGKLVDALRVFIYLYLFGSELLLTEFAYLKVLRIVTCNALHSCDTQPETGIITGLLRIP